MILQEDDKVSALMYFLECRGDEDEEEPIDIPKYFAEDELESLVVMCKELANGIIKNLLFRNLSKETFYQRLWQSLFSENSVLSEEKEKIFALGYLWQDKRIPYYNFGEGIKMSNEEYQKIRKDKKTILDKIDFVLSLDVFQKTQRSSLMLELLEESGSDNEKAVVMSHILDSVQQQARRNFILTQLIKGK